MHIINKMHTLFNEDMIKKSILVISILLLISPFAIAQNNRKIIASIKYKVTYTAEKQVVIDDTCQLDVTKSNSFFYSLGLIESAKRIDTKSKKAAATNTVLLIEKGDIKMNNYRFNTIKDYSKNQSIVTEYIGGQTLGHVRDSLSNMKWVILNERKKINNLMCQKAQVTIGKINTVAWYCSEIPLKEGPFYYCGLPGLIVKLSNSLGWEAELISANFNNKEKRDIEIWPYKLVSKAQFNKAKRNEDDMLKMGKLPGGGSFEKEGN